MTCSPWSGLGCSSLPSSSTILAEMPGSGAHRRTRLAVRHAGQRGDHDRAGLGLPPGVHDRGRVAAEHQAIPPPRLGVDRFADRAQQPQTGQVVGEGDLAAPLHERPDQRRGGVIDCHAVLFDDLEVPVLVGGGRGALVDDLGDAVGQRTVDDVGVPGDPADVGGAPVDVGLGLDVEHVVVGVGRLREVAAGGVHDALGLAGGARGVQQEQRVLGVERLRGVLGARPSDDRRATTGRGLRSTVTSIPVRRTTRTCCDGAESWSVDRLVDALPSAVRRCRGGTGRRW